MSRRVAQGLVPALLLALGAAACAPPVQGPPRAPRATGVRSDQPVGSVLPSDLGQVRVARGARSLVLSAGPAAPDPALIAAAADAAVQAVTDVWGSDWDRFGSYVLVGGPRDLAAVLGRPPEQVRGLVAVAVQGRVVVDGSALAALPASGRSVVLAHETTHLATGAAGQDGVPMWLEEGFADYVGLRRSSVAVRTAAAPLLDRVRRDGLPDVLPSDADFAAGRADLGASYAGAWLACRYLAERYGEAELVALYRATAAGGGSPEHNLEAALTAGPGTTTAAVTEGWRRAVWGLVA